MPPNAEPSGSAPLPLIVTLAIVLAIVLITTGVMAFSGNAPAPGTSATGSRPIGHGLTPESALCASINSNDSLRGSVSGIYRGLPNVTRSWSPITNTTYPANESAYPSLTDAQQELLDAWNSICSSAAYGTLEEKWGANNATGGMELNGTTGHYQINFGIYWHANCSDPSYRYGTYCQESATWYVDLVTATIEGPLFTERSEGGSTGGPTPISISFDNATNTSKGGSFWYNYTAEYVLPGLTVGQLQFGVKTVECGTVNNVLGIVFAAPDGSVLSSENLTTLGWGPDPSTALSVGDLLSISSRGSLIGDGAWMQAPDVAEGWQIAGSGQWAGCFS